MASHDEASLIWIVEIMVQNLGHLKHVHFVLFENSSHGVIAADLSLVTGILKVICANIFPELFD